MAKNINPPMRLDGEWEKEINKIKMENPNIKTPEASRILLKKYKEMEIKLNQANKDLKF